MKQLGTQIKMVGPYLLEWQAFPLTEDRIVTRIHIYRKDGETWKSALSMDVGDAFELQLALRDVVLEIKTAIEEKDSTK
jgi:hypothetical protein